MSGILRILFLVLFVGLARWLISKLKAGPRRSSATRKPAPAPTLGKMIRDPHCGTYVAPELAVSTFDSGKTLLFCSEGCRDDYLKSQTRQTAAS